MNQEVIFLGKFPSATWLIVDTPHWGSFANSSLCNSFRAARASRGIGLRTGSKLREWLDRGGFKSTWKTHG